MAESRNVPGDTKLVASTPDSTDISPDLRAITQALEAARSKLLDRSLRNRLIHTNITSSKARQIRVIDEQSTEVFSILRAGRVMTMSAARKALTCR